MKSKKDNNYTSRALQCLEDSNYVFTIKSIRTTGDKNMDVEENTMRWYCKQIKELYKEPKPIYNRFEILDIQIEEGQIKVEEVKENKWHLINPIRPVDEKMYDIKLKDGIIIENVEFWAFKSTFINSNGVECNEKVVEFKERL